jgi:hypothetical protein
MRHYDNSDYDFLNTADGFAGGSTTTTSSTARAGLHDD